MKTFYIKKLSRQQIDKLYERRAVDDANAKRIAADILAKVKKEGDRTLFYLNEKYDGAKLDTMAVSSAEIKNAEKRISNELKKAFAVAAANIEKFHKAGIPERVEVQTMPGVSCFAESRPIERVGLYVPGGSASLPSTVLMLAIPAKLAGCKEVILCTPPGKNGEVADSILYAADLCGVTKIYKVGGAQAIGAMAYGTNSVPKVFKIFGPGNSYVTAAKQLVSIDPAGAAMDMPAGPSEVMVIADKSSRADFAAADLLAQAEHGPDSMAVLVCTDEKKAGEIKAELKKQLTSLPRKTIAETALKNSFVLIVPSMEQALDFANGFASEHLILCFDNAEKWVGQVRSAGSVFIGPYSSESAGDYASGTNHSLPTYGHARAYSGVSVASFQTRITFQKVTREGAKNLAPAVMALAGEEELEAHRRAMGIRL